MSMGEKVISGSIALLSIKLLMHSLGFISVLLLARLLSPDDFGIFAIALLAIQFGKVMANMGAQQYIMRAESIKPGMLDTAWTLNIASKFVVVALIYLAAPLLTDFWDNEQATIAILVMAPSMLIHAFANPELLLDRRELSYKRIFKIEVTQKIISFLVTVAIAFAYRSYWAMIIGDIVSAIVGTLLSYHYCKHRPRFNFVGMTTQWHFSKWMLCRAYVGYFRTQIDTLIISGSFTLAELGRYNLSREVTVLPAIMIIQPTFEPLLASFADAQANVKRLASRVMSTLLIVSIVVSPICVILFTFHEETATLLLGPKWTGAGDLIQALAPLLFIFSISGILTNIFVAVGKVKTIFFLDLLALVVLCLALILGRSLSIEMFTWLRTLVGGFATLMLLMWAIRGLKVIWYRPLFLTIAPVALASSLVLVADFFGMVPTAVTLIPFSILLTAIYAAIVIFTARRAAASWESWSTVDLLVNRLLALVQKNVAVLRK